MICHIGIASEYKNLFSKEEQDYMYKTDPNIMGVAYRDCETAWIFVDRIMFSDEPFYRAYSELASKDKKILGLFYDAIIKDIITITVHELIHLCGYGEEVAYLGEEMI